MFRKTFIPLAVLIIAMAWLVAGRAEAQLRPSSAVLLPYFEVDMVGGNGKTTMFAVGNVLSQPVDILIEVRSNWGIVVASIPVRLEANEVRSFNLRDWIVQGRLPNKVLKQAEKVQLKMALTGQPSQVEKLYYSTAVAPNLAVGSVVIKVQGVVPGGALWGDFLLVDPAMDISMGDDLINIDKAPTCPGSWLCLRHALRFLSGAELDTDTQVIIWTDRSGQPSKNPYPESRKIAIDGSAYSEAGEIIDAVHLRLLPLAVVSIESLGLSEPFGWLDLKSEEPTFIGIHFDSPRRDGAALQAYCLKDVPPTPPTPPGGPKIEIEKRTNDQDADSAPGPRIPVGSPVRWDYIVTNTGNVRLTNVAVTDDQGVNVNCPKVNLDPAETMTCYADGTATACQYVNVGTATGKPPSGPDVLAADASHYFGTQNAKIDIETATNGQDADTPTGPTLVVGAPVNWTYVVTNTGDVNLAEVKVTDDKGVAVSCSKTSLRPGESMTCTASGVATAGQYANVGSVAAKSPCDEIVKDADPSHYFGRTPGTGINIKKYTNGQDADSAPGPEIISGSPVQWTYVVTNTGEAALSNVKVTDNRGVAVSCPKTTLQPGEAMTCTGNGTATTGQYENIGTAVGTPPSGPNVSDTDPSHYYGKPPLPRSISIKKYTNGQDADSAPGPEIPVGDPVQWTYIVTNTGGVALSNVRVTDNRGVTVSCPKNTLQPSEAMTCTGNGTATAGQYENIGSAVGTPPSGSDVTSSDPSHYKGKVPPQCSIHIKKYTNGEDADSAPGPEITVGNPVQWTYVVTNTGGAILSNVKVTDNRGVIPSCPKTTLQPGEVMTCTGNGTATSGQYENIGTATGTPPSGSNVSDTDPSHYKGKTPPPCSIHIKKYTNGEDADSAPGPEITVGNPVQWTYVVTNTGGAVLSNVKVTDNRGVVPSCPKTTLQPGEVMTCTGNGTATSGQYENIGTATGTPPGGSNVSDTDPSHYKGKTPPPSNIYIKKYTNGQDADSAPGPEILVGSPVQWTYVVTNTGGTVLSNVKVTDNRGVVPSCPKTTLQPAEVMTCTGNGTATYGQYENIGTATGTPPSGSNVSDTDPSHYKGKTPPPSGCSHGYWKTHPSSWPPTGYPTSMKVKDVFSQASGYSSSIGNSTLLQALSFDGGSGVEGKAKILLRQAVAALLNSAHPSINYPRSTASVITSVNAALASHDEDDMEDLEEDLDDDNGCGCPLN